MDNEKSISTGTKPVYEKPQRVFDPISQVQSEIIDSAEIVGKTFGPNGHPVLINPKNERAFFSSDGVTVIRWMSNKDLGTKLLRDAAERVVAKCGDGTTTVCLLTQAMLRHGILIENIDEVCEQVKEWSTPAQLQDIIHVSTAAIRDNEMGEAIGKLVYELGEDGFVRGSRGMEFREYAKPGYELGSGILLPQQLRGSFPFVNKHRESISMYNPLVVIVEHTISKVEQVLAIFQAYRQATGGQFDQPLVLVATDIEEKPLRFIVANFFDAKQKVPCFVIQAPDHDKPQRRYDILQDLAFATGADVYSKLSAQAIDHKGKGFKDRFGRAESLEVSRIHARFVVDTDPTERIEELKDLPDTDDKKARISRLSGAIGIIEFDAETDAEAKNLELRLEDGVLAGQSALRAGFVQGGRFLWESLAAAFPIYDPIFKNLYSRLPESKSYDSTEVIVQALRSAHSLASQVKNAVHVIEQ